MIRDAMGRPSPSPSVMQFPEEVPSALAKSIAPPPVRQIGCRRCVFFCDCACGQSLTACQFAADREGCGHKRCEPPGNGQRVQFACMGEKVRYVGRRCPGDNYCRSIEKLRFYPWFSFHGQYCEQHYGKRQEGAGKSQTERTG